MRIALIGAGGHAKVVFDAIFSTKQHEVIGVVDDNLQLAGTRFFNIENWSFLLDLKILWKTIFVLLKRDELYGKDGISRAKS